MKQQNQYSYQDLLDCAEGKMFGPGNAKLPAPPMLMFDRITSITAEGGLFNKGEILAELDIKDNLWFFECHFKGDPVMPGCLGLDAMWQLLGFYLGWLGNPGHGRALGVNEVKFTGEVVKQVKLVKYVINIKRLLRKGETCVGLADGLVFADNNEIYNAKNLKVGLFKS
jgi:3-hydroxyacyl-[acyl-carrier protein] dehydratase/trans-2-decenoyl-[acyl-carrier protein] isomerase